jgi:Tol biopolymer transport system component
MKHSIVQPPSPALVVAAIALFVALGVAAAAGSAAEREPRLTFTRIDVDGTRGLFTIAADGGPETRLVADRGWIGEFAWSPDGERIAFVGEGSTLNVADADGGGQRVLARRLANWYGSLSWAPDGNSIAFVRGRRIFLADVATGRQRALRASSRSRRDLYPDWSPDGRDIAYTTTPVAQDPAGPDGRIAVTDVLTGRTRVLAAGASPAWSTDGTRLAFRRAGRLYIVPRRGGSATRLSDANVISEISWSPDGREVLFAASRQGREYTIRTVAADGSHERVLSSSPSTQSWPAWSPGGTRIAFLTNRDSSSDYETSIHAVNADGSCETRMTFGGQVGPPGWRPVGELPPIRCG